jgi:hypothetical protein
MVAAQSFHSQDRPRTATITASLDSRATGARPHDRFGNWKGPPTPTSGVMFICDRRRAFEIGAVIIPIVPYMWRSRKPAVESFCWPLKDRPIPELTGGASIAQRAQTPVIQSRHCAGMGWEVLTEILPYAAPAPSTMIGGSVAYGLRAPYGE